MKAKAGDLVKIETSDGIREGRLLPRPEMLEGDITVLKLHTGYNIGISNKKIKSIKVVKKYKAPAIKKSKIGKKKGLPTVAILSTGGTISSRIDYHTGGVYADYTAEDFVAMCPELKDIANIEAHTFGNYMSEDIAPKDIEKIAKEVIKTIDKVDGVVITHGTDTLHFTAAALSFLLEGLGKPVVITGSQRSIDRGSSDAFMNLICSVTAAAKWTGASVVTCLHGTTEDKFCNLIRGTKVRKMHTSRRDAFRAINDEPLARVYLDGRIENIQEVPKRHNNKTRNRGLVEKGALIHAYPGLDPCVIDHHVKNGVKGIVIAGTAFGHVTVNGHYSLLPALQKAVKKGVHIFIASQTIYGSVNPYVYTNLRKLSIKLGATFLKDMLSESAYMKLLVALKQKDPVGFMKENIAGEYKEREEDHVFLV